MPDAPPPAVPGVRLSICVVNWNTVDDLRACLASLQTNPYTRGPMEIVVVDNGSKDGSAHMVRSEFPDVVLVANEKNENFAKGTNQSVQAATGDLLLLLNPDTEVKPGALDALAEFLQTKPCAGAVAAKLVYPTGQTQPSVRGFPTPWAVLWDIIGLARLFPRSRTLGAYRQAFFDYEADGLAPQPMASCFLITRQAWETVGPMDERFPLFFNDVDWCLRAKMLGLRFGTRSALSSFTKAAERRAKSSKRRFGSRTAPCFGCMISITNKPRPPRCTACSYF